MQIIHFKKFCVPVSTGTSKVDKLLKMPPDSVSEGVIFHTQHGYRHIDNSYILRSFVYLCLQERQRLINY